MLFEKESVDTLNILINSAYNKLRYTSNKERRAQIIEYAKYLEKIRGIKLDNEMEERQ